MTPLLVKHAPGLAQALRRRNLESGRTSPGSAFEGRCATLGNS